MIKRLRFSDDGADHARARAEAAAAAPTDVRPSRLAVAATLPGDEAPRHGALVTEWFLDAGHLARFDGWSPPPDEPAVELLVDEVVLRGEDWLDARWAAGGDVVKHVAVAVRAEGLTPEEFSARWRGHAGQVDRPGQAKPVAIPADVRGEAYVQNHPHPGGAAGAYDAVNEVYFADASALQQRVEWFRENEVGRPDGLFGRSWFLAMRESLLLA